MHRFVINTIYEILIGISMHYYTTVHIFRDVKPPKKQHLFITGHYKTGFAHQTIFVYIV